MRPFSSVLVRYSLSHYLYDDLLVPIANYFPGEEYPELNIYPISTETPLTCYIKEHRCAVHNELPEIREIWEKSPKHNVLMMRNLNYVLVAPLLYEEHWMGSINLARRDPPFATHELNTCVNISKMIITFFESSEKLFRNNVYITLDISENNEFNIQLRSMDFNCLLKDSKTIPLTRREQEVLELLTDGCTYCEISSCLCVSVNTVKYHLRNIFQKTGTNSRAKLLQMLYRK